MTLSKIINRVVPLFSIDDGSLPDIFIENLSDEEIVKVYTWILDNSQIYGDPTLWHIEKEADIPIKSISNPAKLFVDKKVEPFRHGLDNLIMDNIEIPGLTISVEFHSISFDYRMGKEWKYNNIEALFKFLYHIYTRCNNPIISQADEGRYEHKNDVFESSLKEYIEITKS